MNRAFLVGINSYPGAPLRGCVNDITDMAKFLVESCGFTKSDIRLLTDDRATTQGILDRLGWLITGARKGDRLFFHYSGHGAQMPTRSAAGEVDGLDEVICPVDFDWSDAHAIRDKDFHRLFLSVPDGVEFVWVSDSCHSGDLTRGMLPPNAIPKTFPAPADIDWRIQTALGKKQIAPLTMLRSSSDVHVALIAGCRSDQTSSDAVFNGRPNGALTYFLIKGLEEGDGLKKPLTNLIQGVTKALTDNRYDQKPQVEGDDAIIGQGFLAVA